MWSISDNISGWEGSYSRWYENTGIEHRLLLEKACELLKKVGLEDKKNQYPNSLSGGQKQRVAIGRALAMEPKLMCFDEPTSALDPELTEEVANIIKRLNKKGMTMLIITHDMSFAEKVASRIISMDNGELIHKHIYRRNEQNFIT